jgi:hypothetical protein
LGQLRPPPWHLRGALATPSENVYSLLPPLMNMNPTLPQRREKIKALAIRFLILGTPLTKATSLPPIVMALEKYLVDQANRPGLKQSWNQIKLRPFHIHFHHHKVLLRHRVLQPLCKIKPLNLIHLTSI